MVVFPRTHAGELMVLAPEILQKNTRTHFDGNNNWVETLLKNKKNPERKKKSSFPKRKKSLNPVVISVKMCPCVFLQERNRKHRQTWLLFSRGSLGAWWGPTLENSWLFPRRFSVSLLQNFRRTHFDGNNNWVETLLAPPLFIFFFSQGFFIFQKSFIPVVIPVKMCPCVFLQNFSKNTFRETTMSSPAWVLEKGENPFLAATFSFPEELMKISFP